MTATLEKKPSTAVPGYQVFIASLDLYTVALAEASCKIDRDEYWQKENEYSNNYKVATKPLVIEDKFFNVRSTLTLGVMGDKSKSTVVRIVASYDLAFRSSTTSKEFVERFCESDVLLIVMPYFREFVTDITARMHIPPIILPLSTKGR
jgi:preprotein translocase subunit SecB